MDDPWYKDVYLWLEGLTIQKDTSQERERVRKMALRYAVKGRNLYYRDSDGKPKLCLGRSDVKGVLQEFHEGAIGGHFGRDITVARVREQFWWPTIWKDVADHVKTCDNCQRYGPKEFHNALRPYQPVFPFEFIFLDFVVNLPSTPCKNRHLITMTEGLTKWVEAKAVKDANAATATKFLANEIVHRFGVPQVVITDNGSHFRGEFHEFCEKTKLDAVNELVDDMVQPTTHRRRVRMSAQMVCSWGGSASGGWRSTTSGMRTCLQVFWHATRARF